MIRFVILGVVLLALAFWTWKKPRQASVTIWALVATLLVSAGVLKLFPSSFATNVLWYAGTLPLLWASVMVWIYWEKKVWRMASGLAAMTVIGGAMVALLPTPI